MPSDDQRRVPWAPPSMAALLDSFEEEILRASEARQRTGGQQVPFHGDFAAASPSMLNRLRWWAQAFREAERMAEAVEKAARAVIVASTTRDACDSCGRMVAPGISMPRDGSTCPRRLDGECDRPGALINALRAALGKD